MLYTGMIESLNSILDTNLAEDNLDVLEYMFQNLQLNSAIYMTGSAMLLDKLAAHHIANLADILAAQPSAQPSVQHAKASQQQAGPDDTQDAIQHKVQHIAKTLRSIKQNPEMLAESDCNLSSSEQKVLDWLCADDKHIAMTLYAIAEQKQHDAECKQRRNQSSKQKNRQHSYERR